MPVAERSRTMTAMNSTWRETAQHAEALPDRAHPAALQRPDSPPSRLRTGLPVRSLLVVRAREESQQRTTATSHVRRDFMPTTTTTTAVPAEIPIRRGTDVTNHSVLREKGQRPRMVRLTVNLPSHLVEQMRDAVYWTPGLTLAWMIARAVRTSLTELETVHQGPFPRRLKPLRAGRPRLLGQAMNVLPMGAGEGTDDQGNGALRVPAPAGTRH